MKTLKIKDEDYTLDDNFAAIYIILQEILRKLGENK